MASFTVDCLPENPPCYPPYSRGAKQSIRYTGNIVTAVKRFQQRHGLNPDGSIGKGTIAAINVPLSQRIVQIELAMEDYAGYLNLALARS
ncbi:MAG: peptidoglycan-binding protein [Methylococcales bacterium]|nr:peptidoglycan-binding protein [Methylococcales bacterium]